MERGYEHGYGMPVWYGMVVPASGYARSGGINQNLVWVDDLTSVVRAWRVEGKETIRDGAARDTHWSALACK